MNLYTHQKEILFKAPKKHLLAWECGTGKTLAAIELAKKSPEIEVLVIVPKSLKTQWQEELKKHTLFWTVLTKEEFKKQAPTLRPYNCLIVDEAHYFSGIKSAMSKALLAYLKKHRTEYVYLLSATPYLSTSWNIYVLGRILGRSWGYPEWRRHFFYDVKMGNRMVPVQRKGIEKEIAAIVNKLGNTVRMDECVDIPEQVFETETFELTREQRIAIDSVDDFEPIVRWTKTHQICGGTLKSDGYNEDQFFKSEKMDRLKDLIKEHKKIIIVCRYNNEIDYIYEEAKKIRDNIYKITGRNNDRASDLKDANQRDEAILLVNAACSEGWEAPDFPIMVFYSYDFSLKNYLQMLGRIQRINNIKKNVYLSLIVKDTIDEDVMKCVMSKKDFDIEIYNK